MNRPLRYIVDSVVYRLKFSDTSTMDSVNMLYASRDKKTVLKASQAALRAINFKVKPDQTGQWVYHKMLCFHLQSRSDHWFEKARKIANVSDTLTGAPDLVKVSEPEYPAEFAPSDSTRIATPSVLVDERGQSRVAVIGRSSGNQSLDQAALVSAIYSKFRPGLRNGEPVPLWVTYNIQFMTSTSRHP